MSNTDWSGTWPSPIASWGGDSHTVVTGGGEDEGDLTFTGF